jgi:hypothetical protein
VSGEVSVHEAKLSIVDDDGGCTIYVNGRVVAAWTGDGVAGDTVFVETPALIPMVSTTAQQRCIGQVFEMASWEVLSAVLGGPGDGDLVRYCEAYREVGEVPE